MTMMTHHRRWATAIATALVTGTLLLTTGCDSSPNPTYSPQSVAERGQLIRAEHLRTYSVDDVKADLTGNGFDSSAAQFGVETYRLVYRTIDLDDRATTASGLLALPRGGQHELSTVAYEHGTQPTKSDAASVVPDSGDVAAVLTYAAAGFAGVAPDYLGLGLGSEPHPYLNVPSETTASLDMLCAARTEATVLDRQLRDKIYITGFSQGGPAAMDLARTLQAGPDNTWRAAAVAAISGPFDLRTAELPAALNHTLDPASAGFYTAYLLVSWNRLHHLYQSPSEVFQPPYDTTMDQLLDGTRTNDELHRGFPDSIDRLLTPHAMDMLRNPTGPLADALRVSDSTCNDWTPRLPIRLYIGDKDADVATENSAQCHTSLQQHGVDAPIIDVGPVDHNGSGIRGTALALSWFTQLDAAR
ncbi:alpha/beta hydrolase family protein [Nocardia sp. CA-135953]|uniref:alpha/beta hydrolase family protein n=1 Tax=Nocardia sp. CA-135953 TaxID=3239978 RepID=UPI003D96E220